MAAMQLAVALCLVFAGAAWAQTCPDVIPASPRDYELIGGRIFNLAPNGLVVFPDRDFVTIEGFAKYEGCELLVEVIRDSKAVGSARGTVSGTDVAFEINHPGGVCWGAGTNLKVTPDIKAGDLVRISYDGETIGETLTAPEVITGKPLLDGTVLTIEGTVGPNVDPDNLEARIIEPALKDTDVTRRDARAVNGGLAAADKGGYSSSLTVDADAGTFVARYEFLEAETAEIAAGGGPRIMSWQRVDVDGNRIALTISEFGELGGPGLGGCPAGPADVPAPAGSATARAISAPEGSSIGSMRVDWTPVEAVPASEPVTGYSVLAIDPDTGVQVGKRTGTDGRFVVIEGLDKNTEYTVEVRSIAAKRMSESFTMIDAAPGGGSGTGPDPNADTTKPVVRTTPADPATPTNSVALASVPANDAVIYYTLDGTSAIDGDGPSATAIFYEKPIPITEATEIHYMAVDAAGNTIADAATFSPVVAAPPATKPVPSLSGSDAGQEQLSLVWSQPADRNVASWQVQLYDAAALTATDTTSAKVGTVVDSAVKSVTIKSLTVDQKYWFAVRGVSKEGLEGDWSARVGPLTPTRQTDRITISSSRWKSGDFRVDGTGSVVGATVTVRSRSVTGAVLATGPVTAAAPPGVGEYSIRVRAGSAANTNPGTIYVTSSGGGVAGPFTVTPRRRRQLS